MMDGLAALRLLSSRRTNEIVFTTMSTISDWSQVSARPELDIAIIRPMAKNSSIGLGLALARPDEGVWVIDGDGSLLMNLGSLVTIGALQPRNLVLVVYQNGTYDTTGGQPVPGQGKVDFGAVARGAGWPSAVGFDDIAAMETGLNRALGSAYPLLLTLRVAPAGRRPFPELTSTPSYIRRVWDYLAQRPVAAQPYRPRLD